MVFFGSIFYLHNVVSGCIYLEWILGSIFYLHNVVGAVSTYADCHNWREDSQNRRATNAIANVYNYNIYRRGECCMLYFLDSILYKHTGGCMLL